LHSSINQNMKVTLLILAVFLSSLVRAQEISVFYKEIRKADFHQLRTFISKSYVSKEEWSLIQEKAKDHKEDLSKYKFTSVLKIDSNKSIHYPQIEITNDTIDSSVTYGQGGKVFISRETSQKDYAIIYMDLDTNKKVSTEFAYGKDYLVSEKLADIEWKITNETKKIVGYTCKKAILFKNPQKQFVSNSYGSCTMNNKERVEVWYTEEIASPFGPAGYWGLPGLIVAVIEDDVRIVLDKILFTLEGYKVKPPKKGEKTTREELENIPMLLFNEH